jgi:hypothetical protein
MKPYTNCCSNPIGVNSSARLPVPNKIMKLLWEIIVKTLKTQIKHIISNIQVLSHMKAILVCFVILSDSAILRRRKIFENNIVDLFERPSLCCTKGNPDEAELLKSNLLERKTLSAKDCATSQLLQ